MLFVTEPPRTPTGYWAKCNGDGDEPYSNDIISRTITMSDNSEPEGQGYRREEEEQKSKLAKMAAWLRVSIANPHNFPHYLIALFTLLLAIFAFSAWIESQRTTKALEGQLQAMRMEQRPYVYIGPHEGRPEFKAPPSGQIVWNAEFANYGKSVAYAVEVHKYIKIGEERYQASYAGGTDSVVTEGTNLPPTKVNFFTVVSRPGYSQEFYDHLLQRDSAIGILVIFGYSDGTDTGRYEDTICMERLAGGAIAYRDPKNCKQ
jgi:hypothetical protein